MFDRTALLNDLVEDEAFRLKPYVDTKGKITIGVGRNLSDNGITNYEAWTMLATDIDTAVLLLDSNLGWWRHVSDNLQRVLVNLTFNMGMTKLRTFVRFLNAVELGDVDAAERELRDSLWWTQVGTRGPRIVARMRGQT